jgi:glycosyltransferase involved in cell wall biosynthesis
MSTVVHLLSALDPGGVETRLIEELGRRGQKERHIVIALSGRAGSLDDAFRAVGGEVVPRRLSWRFPWWFVRFLRAEKATHVDAHVYLTSGYFLLLAMLAGVKRRICYLHSTHDGQADTGVRRLVRVGGRWTVAIAATDIVAVSTSVRDLALRGSRRLRRRARVIHERVDSDRFGVASSPVPGRARLIHIGSINSNKNQERAIAIAARLRAREDLHDVELLIVGQGDTTATQPLAEVAAQHQDVVRLLGTRTDVPELLAESDALLATSLREGLPGVVLEASAAGIPAIVSAIPANEEAARDLPNVIPVPLDAPDDVWCDVIVDAIAARSARFAPTNIRGWFEASDFAIQRESPLLDELWS